MFNLDKYGLNVENIVQNFTFNKVNTLTCCMQKLKPDRFLEY